MASFSLTTFPLKYKTVLVRVDYNVPQEKGEVLDNYKIKATIPTIKFLLHQNCKIILATHLGQPEGKIVPELRLKPIFHELKKLLPAETITLFPDCLGKEIKAAVAAAGPRTIFLLENLRFYKEEEEDNVIFAHSLANLAEVYVNDAFAVSHRDHASVSAITLFLPALPGLLLEQEMTQLSKALHPERPAVWIMGGAKLDKVELLQQALSLADYVLIGGALCFAFLKARGIAVGVSKVDHNSVKTATRLLRSKQGKNIILPVDFLVAESLSARVLPKIVPAQGIQNNQMGLDLGPETIKLFKHYLRKAQTVVWNGPLGYFELAKYATATKEIGRFLGKLTATTICGGGETVEAIHKFHLQHNLTHVSTGGGAALEFLEGKKLPGIAALEKNYLKFRKKFGM